MIIRDAELQGVEIPLPQPALEVAGVTIRPHRGCSKPWLPSANPGCLQLCHPSLARHRPLKLLFHNCQTRGD